MDLECVSSICNDRTKKCINFKKDRDFKERNFFDNSIFKANKQVSQFIIEPYHEIISHMFYESFQKVALKALNVLFLYAIIAHKNVAIVREIAIVMREIIVTILFTKKNGPMAALVLWGEKN